MHISPFKKSKRMSSLGVMMALTIGVSISGCPTSQEGEGNQQDPPEELPSGDMDAGTAAPNLLVDAGNSPTTGAMDAGQNTDAGQSDMTQAADSGVAESDGVSVNMESICVTLEEPDAGFGDATGRVDATVNGSRIDLTVTLFDVNCGITQFNFMMQEQASNQTLNVRVSPVGLTEDTPLTRCYCDMALTADYWDDDNSLERIEAYFFSDVVLPNAQAIPPNGFIGAKNLE
tara:strand:- start:3514 stop:4206 length:693 start_codon:yes stop_codon:yes gene_type:complete